MKNLKLRIVRNLPREGRVHIFDSEGNFLGPGVIRDDVILVKKKISGLIRVRKLSAISLGALSHNRKDT